jgi:uncharacterized protein YqcC (DUF446 family)
MSPYTNSISAQINLIEEAMKKAGVWSEELPDWIQNYSEDHIVNIWQWLQFIHLPMRMDGSFRQMPYLAPRLSAYMDSDPAHRDILQLVIELDSLTSTISKY